MDETVNLAYERLVARYAAGNVPWDEALPPPEVLEFVPTLPAGRALDLGCGFGRASIYMATLGWEVDAIDFIAEALAEASRRAQAADVEVRFHAATVTDLDFLDGPYDFALDVGCGHALDEDNLRTYRNHLRRLLAPGATFMLYARLRQGTAVEDDEGPRGLEESTLLTIFDAGFELIWSEHGETAVEDKPPWPSGWFRFRRL